MKGTNFFISVVGILFLGILMLFLYNKSISFEEEETLKKQIDSFLLALDNKIEEIEKVALTSSVILAKNPLVVECLAKEDRSICVDYLLGVKNAISVANLFDNIRFHLHTKDFKSFVRLWDYQNLKNDPLDSFRHGFEKIKATKRPITGVEIGRHGMFIRAIAPVFSKDAYLGSIEAVVDFKSLNEYFKKDGIDFYVLMNNEHKNISNAITYSPDSKLDNYTIINQETNKLGFVKNINFEGTGYIKKGDYYILHTPIIGINGENIGFYILFWAEKLSLSSFR